MEGNKNYYCSNYREKNCDFVIWKVVAKKKLTKDLLKNARENALMKKVLLAGCEYLEEFEKTYKVEKAG